MSVNGADRKPLQEVFYAQKDKEQLVESIEQFLGVKDRTLLREWLARDSVDDADGENIWTLQISSRANVVQEEPKPKKRRSRPAVNQADAEKPAENEASKE